MPLPHKLDVLIVYTNESARSASDKDYTGRTPFPAESTSAVYNEAYGFFVQSCRQRGLTAGLTTPSDIIGPGLCRNYWTYGRGKWNRVQSKAYSAQIFDKFSPLRSRSKNEWKLLFSSPRIHSFNDPGIMKIFGDKFTTYENFRQHTIPSEVLHDPTLRSIETAISLLDDKIFDHPTRQDFGADIVMKDRFGSAGALIFRIQKNYAHEIYTLAHLHKNKSFILQPFLNFEKGFTYKNITARSDIRLIYHHGELIQTYIRRADVRDFRCNVHQGGSSIYLTKKEIPRKILIKAKNILELIGNNGSLFTLDFVISNSGEVYFLEGNIRPGLYWDPTSPTEAKMSRMLIRSIVKEIARRTHSRSKLTRFAQPLPYLDPPPLLGAGLGTVTGEHVSYNLQSE